MPERSVLDLEPWEFARRLAEETGISVDRRNLTPRDKTAKPNLAPASPANSANVPIPPSAAAEPEARSGREPVARHAYRQAERAKREQDNPRAWRFGLGWLARDFLIQNDAWAWLARPTRVRPRYSVHSWPFDQIPDAATLDALYAELWDEIEREGRYRGP